MQNKRVKDPACSCQLFAALTRKIHVFSYSIRIQIIIKAELIPLMVVQNSPHPAKTFESSFSEKMFAILAS